MVKIAKQNRLAAVQLSETRRSADVDKTLPLAVLVQHISALVDDKQIEKTIIVRRSLDEVFRYVSRFDNIEQWDKRSTYLARNKLYRNTGDGKFIDVSDAAGDGLKVKLSSRAREVESRSERQSLATGNWLLLK